MINCLNAEIYKMRKSMLAYFLYLLIIIISIVLTLMVSPNSTNTNVYADMVNELGTKGYINFIFTSNITIILLVIFVSLSIGKEYHNGNYKTILSNTSRSELYYSKLCISALFVIMQNGLYTVTSILSSMIILKTQYSIGVMPYLFRTIGLVSMADLAFASIFILIITIVRNSGFAICIYFIWNIFISIIANILPSTGYVGKIKSLFLEEVIKDSAMLHLSTSDTIRVAIVPIGIIIVTTLIGKYIFNKSDIK